MICLYRRAHGVYCLPDTITQTRGKGQRARIVDDSRSHSCEQLLALLDQYPLIKDAQDAIQIGRAHGLLEMHGVSFSYPTGNHHHPPSGGIPVLRDVNLRIEPGHLCVLVGPSGSGKSTILSLLLRLYDPTGGEILLDGLMLSKISLRCLQAQYAVMLQETHLFAGSIREVLSTDPEEDEGPLWDSLAEVAMDRYVRTLPDGLDTLLGEDGVNLSGGQRARLSLARAFLLDRPILLLDEPTANVDMASQKVILDALDRIRRNRTCLVVTHQPELMEQADLVLRIDNGRIVHERARL